VFDLTTGGEARPAQGLWVTANSSRARRAGADRRTLAAAADRRGARPAGRARHGFWQVSTGQPVAIGRCDHAGRPRSTSSASRPRASSASRSAARSTSRSALRRAFSGHATAMDKKDVWFLGRDGRLKSRHTSIRRARRLAAISAPIFRRRYRPTAGGREALSAVQGRRVSGRRRISQLRRSTNRRSGCCSRRPGW